MKSLVFKSLISVIILASIYLNAQTTSGGIATGGGEVISQEVRAIITILPNVLESKGLKNFPEVNFTKLKQISNSKIFVELQNEINVNGSPKNFKYDQEQILIQVSEEKWKELEGKSDSVLRKQAIIFHEVLGLLGLEENNDYTISNRLLILPNVKPPAPSNRNSSIEYSDESFNISMTKPLVIPAGWNLLVISDGGKTISTETGYEYFSTPYCAFLLRNVSPLFDRTVNTGSVLKIEDIYQGRAKFTWNPYRDQIDTATIIKFKDSIFISAECFVWKNFGGWVLRSANVKDIQKALGNSFKLNFNNSLDN